MSSVQVLALMASGGANQLHVSLSTTELYKESTNASFATSSVSATISGGTAPYTSLWEIVSSNGNITPTSPNSPSTAFVLSGAGYAEYNAQARLTVTDATNQPFVTGIVSITMLRTRGEGAF